MMVEHDVLNPNDVVMIGSGKFRLRYITTGAFEYHYHFQHAAQQLSPFIENDVLVISVNKGHSLKFEVIPQ